MTSHYDVVIVGAGLQALAAARIFLQLDPGLHLLLVDANKSIGGVWSREKIYPGLMTNNLRGTYEFTDFPLNEAFGVNENEHIPGEAVHEYFCRYADKHDLHRRIRLMTRLTVAEKVDNGWRLNLENVMTQGLESKDETRVPELPAQLTITCAKLIIATGLTSTPLPITFKGSENFKAPIVNFGDYARDAMGICKDTQIKNVTVYGGGKAAYDIVYVMANHGKSVTWVIRASGHGPTYMAPSHIHVGPFRCWLEKLTSTRFLTWFSPCIWGDADGFGGVRKFLHSSSIGRWIVKKLWDKISFETVAQAGILDHAETRKLIPDQSTFWYGVNMSILNYPKDIYEFVRNGQVKVLRKDVKCLESQKTIRFEDGTAVQTDTLICSMGWSYIPKIEFRPKEIHADLGIPSTEYSETQKHLWAQLDARADKEILTRFPELLNGPKMDHIVKDQDHSPKSMQIQKSLPSWRLWRGIAPPLWPRKDIVFLGMVHTIQGALRSEISSLWAYAYMHDQLKYPLVSLHKPTSHIFLERRAIDEKQDKGSEEISVGGVLYDTALFNRHNRWRTPYGYGAHAPDLFLDGIAYFDLLLRDLGLRRWRKGLGWLGEVFGGSYGQADYIGLVQEWCRSASSNYQKPKS